MRLASVAFALLVAFAPTCSVAMSDAAMEKAIRMKTTRQLREILTEAGIEFKTGASKEEMRALVWEHDALSIYEAAHPEKAKKKGTKGRGGRGGGGGAGPDEQQLKMMFAAIDTDQDGVLSAREVTQSGYFAVPGMDPSPEHEAETFRMLDLDGDGDATEAELFNFIEMIQQQQEAMAGGMDPYQEQVDDYQPDTARNIAGDDTCDYATGEEDENIPDP